MAAGFRFVALGFAFTFAALVTGWSLLPAAGRVREVAKSPPIRIIDNAASPGISATELVHLPPPDRADPSYSGRVPVPANTEIEESTGAPSAVSSQPVLILPLVWSQLLSAAEDGPISVDEWRIIGGTVESFQSLDRDGDGFVTWDEIDAATRPTSGTLPNRPAAGEPERSQTSTKSPSVAASTLPPFLARKRLAGSVVIATATPTVVAQIATAPARAVEPPVSRSVPTPKPAPSPMRSPAVAKTLTLADDEAATMPLPLDDGTNPYWAMRNQQNLERIAAGERARVLFLGDSGTDLFSIGLGRPIWDKFFAPIGSINFAVGGATTSQVLWQIETRQVESMAPRVVVVLIGSNNVAVGQSPAAVVRGVTKVVNELQVRLPQSRVLLLGLMPRQAAAADPIRAKLTEVNRQIARLDDGAALRFVDFSARLLEPDGSLSPLVMPDFLHPSLLGYQIYSTSIWPTLLSMLN